MSKEDVSAEAFSYEESHRSFPEPADKSHDEPNLAEHFSESGSYSLVYDKVRHFRVYQEALALHLKWIRKHVRAGDRVIDAGGGSGLMLSAALRLVPGASYLLIDVNQAMLDIAVRNGITRSMVARASIDRMTDARLNRIPDESVTHVYSHSVLWALPDPRTFFAEAARVLKNEGTLAISTLDALDEALCRRFLDSLGKDIEQLKRQGKFSEEEASIFSRANEELLLNSNKISRPDLVAMARAHGFEPVESHGAYRWNDELGEFCGFHQSLFRKSRTNGLKKTIPLDNGIAVQIYSAGAARSRETEGAKALLTEKYSQHYSDINAYLRSEELLMERHQCLQFVLLGADGRVNGQQLLVGDGVTPVPCEVLSAGINFRQKYPCIFEVKRGVTTGSHQYPQLLRALAEHLIHVYGSAERVPEDHALVGHTVRGRTFQLFLSYGYEELARRGNDSWICFPFRKIVRMYGKRDVIAESADQLDSAG